MGSLRGLLVRNVIPTIVLFIWAETAQGSLLSPWHYVKNYQLGFDVGQTSDKVHLKYELPKSDYYGQECSQGLYATTKRCQLSFEQNREGYGMFIQQPFKRRGLWHLDWDVGFSLRSIDGSMRLVSQAGYEGEGFNALGYEHHDAAVTDLKVHLYSLVARPYVTLGLTPRKNFPDLLVSFGPTGEAMWGTVHINERSYTTGFLGTFRRSSVTSLFSYLQFEAVFARFGKGSASLVMSSMEGHDHVEANRLIPEKIGQMEDFRIQFREQFFGLKLLLK